MLPYHTLFVINYVCFIENLIKSTTQGQKKEEETNLVELEGKPEMKILSYVNS